MWRKFGASHTENIRKGLPKHLRGAKITDEAIDELLKLGWLVKVKKTGEDHYFLNPHKKEIKEFYEGIAGETHLPK